MKAVTPAIVAAASIESVRGRTGIPLMALEFNRSFPNVSQGNEG
jgi:hypothetical protein